LKKEYFSSPKLPKQQSTSFWWQLILGVKHHNHGMDAVFEPVVLEGHTSIQLVGFKILCLDLQNKVKNIYGSLF
jgi:hypothetical protein